MREFSEKCIFFRESMIRKMTRVAIECGAINLAQGFPDFDPPKEIMDKLIEISTHGPHQYSISMGSKNFRNAVAKKCGKFMNRQINPETEVVATIGATEAMMDTLQALTNPGDRIAFFSPFFENYRAQTNIVGGEPIYIPLNLPNYTFDPNYVEDVFKKGVKAIIICNPSNPSGRVFTLEELTILADLCKKYNVYAIMDEVYEHIVFDDNKHIYMNSLEGMWERTISISSLSKTYTITGWRLGYAIAPKEIMDKIKQFHDYMSVCAPSPLMEAAVVGLEMPNNYYDELAAHYTHMRKLFLDGLDSIGISYTKPQGSYFMLMDMKEYMRKNEKDVDFCIRMAKDLGVAVVPGSSFFNEDIKSIVRMHFAKVDTTLNEALNRLADINKLK